MYSALQDTDDLRNHLPSQQLYSSLTDFDSKVLFSSSILFYQLCVYLAMHSSISTIFEHVHNQNRTFFLLFSVLVRILAFSCTIRILSYSPLCPTFHCSQGLCILAFNDFLTSAGLFHIDDIAADLHLIFVSFRSIKHNNQDKLESETKCDMKKGRRGKGEEER